MGILNIDKTTTKQKGNLLLVDDEPLILSNLKYTLARLADQVFTAENGELALEIIMREKIDCILCDINMPRMNGIELIKRIRGMENNVPFIFFTAYGNKEIMLEVVKYGAFDFLNKPYFEGIEEVVQRGLTHSLSSENPTTQQEFISEYQKMLDKISNEN